MTEALLLFFALLGVLLCLGSGCFVAGLLVRRAFSQIVAVVANVRKATAIESLPPDKIVISVAEHRRLYDRIFELRKAVKPFNDDWMQLQHDKPALRHDPAFAKWQALEKAYYGEDSGDLLS